MTGQSAAKPRAKIAVFIPSLQGAGAERMGLLLAETLVEAGYAVEIPVACVTGSLVGHGIAATHVVDLKAPNELLCLPQFLRYVDRSKPDLVVAIVHTAKMTAGLARKLRPGLNVILSVRHDLPTHPFWLRRLLGYGFERWLYKGISRVHVVSRDLIPQVVEHFGIEQSRVTAVYNPIRKSSAIGDIAPEHEALFDRPVIMTAGRMVEQKDQKLLIEAFHRAGLAGRVRLLILGEGVKRPELERQVRQLQLEDSVAMPGFAIDVRPYMRRSIGFVLSSRSEGLANVLLEALDSGTAVASFDCPVGPREILSDGRLGRLVSLGDVEELAQAMRDMADGTLTPPDRGDVARLMADFQLDAVKRRYVEMVERALVET